MALAARISELERELEDAQEERIVLDARIRGLEESLKVLRSNAEPVAGLAKLTRTEAIMKVLREHRTPMCVADIQKAFAAAGRTGDDKDLLGATLSYLLGQNLVERPARGRYRSVA